ncbi:hypothetical protein M9194_10735 [Vibrio sp. S4M6]|uniref:hypothetical protein n=1 Tax=Vibrio sinus TaxID=2946865 RepID=UPI002029C5FC|nr:hypothetical protein [Vibrio sinus]MCL9781904.1 hypothetical protein [Vibrio sinus]
MDINEYKLIINNLQKFDSGKINLKAYVVFTICLLENHLKESECKYLIDLYVKNSNSVLTSQLSKIFKESDKTIYFKTTLKSGQKDLNQKLNCARDFFKHRKTKASKIISLDRQSRRYFESQLSMSYIESCSLPVLQLLTICHNFCNKGIDDLNKNKDFIDQHSSDVLSGLNDVSGLMNILHEKKMLTKKMTDNIDLSLNQELFPNKVKSRSVNNVLSRNEAEAFVGRYILNYAHLFSKEFESMQQGSHRLFETHKNRDYKKDIVVSKKGDFFGNPLITKFYPGLNDVCSTPSGLIYSRHRGLMKSTDRVYYDELSDEPMWNRGPDRFQFNSSEMRLHKSGFEYPTAGYSGTCFKIFSMMKATLEEQRKTTKSAYFSKNFIRCVNTFFASVYVKHGYHSYYEMFEPYREFQFNQAMDKLGYTYDMQRRDKNIFFDFPLKLLISCIKKEASYFLYLVSNKKLLESVKSRPYQEKTALLKDNNYLYTGLNKTIHGSMNSKVGPDFHRKLNDIRENEKSLRTQGYIFIDCYLIKPVVHAIHHHLNKLGTKSRKMAINIMSILLKSEYKHDYFNEKITNYKDLEIIITPFSEILLKQQKVLTNTLRDIFSENWYNSKLSHPTFASKIEESSKILFNKNIKNFQLNKSHYLYKSLQSGYQSILFAYLHWIEDFLYKI